MSTSNEDSARAAGHAVILTNGSTLTKSNPQDYQLEHDFSIFRRLVPLLHDKSITYLNAASAPPSNLIVNEALSRWLNESLYQPAPKPQWQSAKEEVRELVARYINADPSEIAFARDTTEALGSFVHGVTFKPGDNVVILDSEHPNHAYSWMARRSDGLEVRQVPTMITAEKTGEVVAANADTFAPFVDDRTVAIGLSSIMFHSGQWNDVADICARYRSRGIHVLADVTQHVGFAQVDVRRLGVSAAAFSLHKGLNCPTGLACLYVDTKVIKELEPVPPIVGYGAVQNCRPDLLVPSEPIVYHPSARRYEHLNLSLVSSVAAKAFLAFYLDVMGADRVENHLYTLGEALRARCQELGIRIVGPKGREGHAPHLYILDLHDPRWAEMLKGSGIYVTPYRLGIRVSFGFYNNLEDIDILARALRSGLESGLPKP